MPPKAYSVIQAISGTENKWHHCVGEVWHNGFMTDTDKTTESTQSAQPADGPQPHAVHHEPEQSRFVITVGGEEAGFTEYETHGTVRDFNHTVVDGKFRGQGLSKPLIETALEETRREGLSVQPTCSAVEGFIAKNPSYQDLLVEK